MRGKVAYLSILVPVCNGAAYLEDCVNQLADAAAAIQLPWEILICEGGSTDQTRRVCETLKARYPFVRAMYLNEKGRGLALTHALDVAKGDILLYVDVDMATDIHCLDSLVASVTNGSDVVTGSRYLPQSQARRTLFRLVLSKTFNGVVRLLFHSTLMDHQCGFKAFKRSAFRLILPSVQSTQWFWDTELLVRAQALGLRVDEIPVHWREMPDGSTMNFARDVPIMLRDMLILKKKLRQQLAS